MFYVGVDIDECNINDGDVKRCDETHFFDVEVFFDKVITEIDHTFDYIICSHVIEHLPDKDILFKTIKQKLVKGGQCLITTPNINSVNFPSAKGTLNYYDDHTHVEMPVPFQHVYDQCLKNDLRIIKVNLRNKSILSYLIGLSLEPFRMLLKRTLRFTWSYWGFEDLYIIEKT